MKNTEIVRLRSVSKATNVLQRIQAFTDWYKLVFPINRFFNGPMTMHMRFRGIPVYIRNRFATDYLVAMDLFWENQYHLDTLTLPITPRVIDLGANIGMFSLAVKQYNPTANITAYEPHPDTFKILQKNAPFATLKQKAASGTGGIVQFQRDGGATGLHIIEKEGIAVESETLDQILSKESKVDLLKIDIEGAEYDLLEKCSPEALQKVQRIFIEVHDCVPDRFVWAERVLIAAGFKIRWEDPNGVIYGWR